MSNPCRVAVEGSPIILYQHWGGNPERMIPFLKEFHEWFMKERRYLDSGYAIAQLVRRTAFEDAGNGDETLQRIATGFGLYVEGANDYSREGPDYTIKEDGIYYNGVAVK